MARLLVIAQSRSANDRDWTAGDVVDKRPDGFVWGASETLPKFWQIDVPDITEIQAAQVTIEQQVDDTGAPYGVIGQPQMFRRRSWRIQKPLLTVAMVNQLNATGQLTITATDLPVFTASIKRVRDNLAFPGF